ncbi:MAG: hypothetical protein WC829_11460 [Hyphomicrobium sp.]|jgi:hypothetical protein
MSEPTEEQRKKVSDLIFKLWHEVLKTVGKLLEADAKFGFLSIEEQIDPSIEDIVFGLTMMDSIISILMNSNLLEHDETRQALNSKQCVLHIKRLAEALAAGDQEEYNEVIKLLNNQSKLQ